MNNTRIPFDSYAYKPPNMQAYRNPALQAQYRNLSNSRMQSPAYSRTRGYIPQMPNSGEASRTVIFVVLGILIVGIFKFFNTHHLRGNKQICITLTSK
jgi:hypothetical protein